MKAVFCNFPRSRGSVACLLVLTLVQTGCGWVDSTGRQAGDILASGDNTPLAPGGSIGLLEAVPQTRSLSGNNDGSWQWQYMAAGNVSDCSRFEGFDATRAKGDLAAACATSDDCQFDIVSASDAVNQLTFRLPPLKAPVAMRYRASSVDSSGIVHERQHTVCGIAINEAPEALDDSYRIRIGQRRIVSGSSNEGLLANDSDDNDEGNEPLRVLTTAYRQPALASEFTLYADGGFIYRSDVSLAESATEDSFQYTVTDGAHEVVATVTITLTEDNRAPVLDRRLSNISVDAGKQVDIDLAPSFSDPDRDPLTFSVTESSLPESGNLYVTAAGQLRGNPSRADAGRYRVVVVASDGEDTVAGSFILDIEAPPNRPPKAADIRNQSVSGDFELELGSYFSDPDGDPLTFSSNLLPFGVSLDENGTLVGSASFFNIGTWRINITATDPEGLKDNEVFRLTIRR